MRRECSDVVNRLVNLINNDNNLYVEAHLVCSGAKNLEIQNANEPIDLDYNLNIIKCYKFDTNDCMNIKEYTRKMFNKVLNYKELGDCQDSTSALTVKGIYFTNIHNQTRFGIDLCITT